MAWRHSVALLEHAPLDSFEPYGVRLQKLEVARGRHQSMVNWLVKALRDLEAVERGEVGVTLNLPGGFPTDVNWVTGQSLPDGRYRIACALAHEPRFEDDLSRRAEARAEETQAAAVAERQRP